jgi:hypothetical protein
MKPAALEGGSILMCEKEGPRFPRAGKARPRRIQHLRERRGFAATPRVALRLLVAR